MKIQLLIFLIAFILITSCNHKQTETENHNTEVTNVENIQPKLYIKTTTATGIEAGQSKDEITVVESAYFEVGLYSVDNGTNYTARKDIINPNSTKDFKVIFFYIVKEDGTVIVFSTSTEFLNFMADRGYEMVDQKKEKYHTDYTFKRK